MMAEPIGALELNYPMIQFLIMTFTLNLLQEVLMWYI